MPPIEISQVHPSVPEFPWFSQGQDESKIDGWCFPRHTSINIKYMLHSAERALAPRGLGGTYPGQTKLSYGVSRVFPQVSQVFPGFPMLSRAFPRLSKCWKNTHELLQTRRSIIISMQTYQPFLCGVPCTGYRSPRICQRVSQSFPKFSRTFPSFPKATKMLENSSRRFSNCLQNHL